MLNKLTKIKRLLLIGKEIWHNKRSMRGRFIIYLLPLVLLAGSAMLILLNVIGIVQPPSHDIDRFLEYELNTRTNDIKRQMNALAAHNIDLSQQLQNDIDRVMLEQGIYNNYDALNNNPEALTAIQQATYQTLAAKMQQAPASGALYLINASVNTNLLEPTYNGLFLKFTNIYSENTLFNETCMFRGNPQVARNNNISLYSTWQLELNVHAYPQADKLLHAKENNISQQYILTDVAHLKESWEQSRLFLMPINSNNGRIIGICGFEISSVYFQQRTKQANYKGYPLITAILDKKADNEYQGQLSNPASFVNATIKTSSDGEHELFTAGQERFIGFTAPLKVGVSEHKVAVMLPADSYYHLQGQAKMRLLIMLGIILLLSLLSAGYFSKKYVDPLVADLQQLQQNPDAPPQANVLELNQFFEFLQNHSEQQVEKLRQLQSENNQVQKQYGLAAMRLQEAQEKQKQTANQYIQLEEQLATLQNEIQQVRLQMEQTQQEKLQAQQEREQAQQQFNFAQAALEKAIEKKLESVDPDSYQMFIDNLATLTPKEEDIFNLYVQGCSTKDIISQLGITENTLKYHNKNIYSKLGVKTRKELLQYIELMRNSAH
ncbi:LuxR C-terminal-related transcriptional regulator [Phascolarctobacterium succinatutens]|uniref:LuxR C-terminal-related transcriptional regulator n=1 Tax=Phascolarctobacterium succinatutens TaxID=626940 RepID=UPI003079A2CC